MFNKQSVYMLIVAFFVMIAYPEHSSAEFVDVTGGIKNEYDYEEYVFLTGQPVKFIGQAKDIKVDVAESGNKRTEKYSLKLKGPNNASLTRSITYTYDVVVNDIINQKTANLNSISKPNEKITIGNTTFTLADYQFTKGIFTDMRAASDYYDSDGTFRKTYTYKSLTGQDRSIVVTGQIKSYGYQNFWGAAETQIVTSEYMLADGSIATVKSKASHASSKTLSYSENEASLSSYNGGWMTVTDAETMAQYEYNFPNTGNYGNVELNKEYLPKIEKLIVPKFRDIASSFARVPIEKLYSLGVYKDNSNFFSPNTPMLRYDFAVAIGKAVDLRVDLTGQTARAASQPALFSDVRRTRNDYAYLVAAYNRGVVSGVTATEFMPDGVLTREQAAMMIVRALGLENKAPDPGYQTNYRDNAKISNYAKDAVYVISEIGLMQGYNGKFNPKGILTRAESSVLIERLLNYLESDLKQNYRDDIWFFE